MDGPEKLPVREYAKARGLSPQLVYYHLREHPKEISIETCLCGRHVIDVKLADEYFDVAQEKRNG